MSYYDDIYEVAVDQHYLFTTADAADAGIPGIELVKLAQRGRLKSLSNGVYRLARYVPSDSDPYAVAVARVGRGAYLYGESVLALLGLAPTNPAHIYVATPRRVRRNLPFEIVLVHVHGEERITHYEDICCQRVAMAIRACKGTMMRERLEQAARQGRREGFITAAEEERLREDMGWQ